MLRSGWALCYSLRNGQDMELTGFIEFDPKKDKGKDLPEVPGNYLVTIRDINSLPTLGYSLEVPLYKGKHLIYTGVAGTNLRGRIWRNHIGGNAGHSTLRLTIGCLLGYTPIPRDKKNPNNGHVRFVIDEERELRAWMKENLVFHYLHNESPDKMETKLIEDYNPPLNIDKNKNPINQEYRDTISSLRTEKPWLK